MTTPTTLAAPVSDLVLPATPDNLAAPLVTGDATTGGVLTATPGDWTDPSVSYLYSWERCAAGGSCLPIAGTNAGTYRVGLEDLGRALRVTVTATNAGGATFSLARSA